MSDPFQYSDNSQSVTHQHRFGYSVLRGNFLDALRLARRHAKRLADRRFALLNLHFGFVWHFPSFVKIAPRGLMPLLVLLPAIPSAMKMVMPTFCPQALPLRGACTLGSHGTLAVSPCSSSSFRLAFPVPFLYPVCGSVLQRRGQFTTILPCMQLQK